MSGTIETKYESDPRSGYLTEILVEGAAYGVGLNISRPMTPLRYDQIWDLGHKLLRVQVKHSNPLVKNDIVYGLEFKSDGYNSEEIDGFATYFEDKLYYIPIKESANITKLYFIVDSQISDFKWAEDYEVNSRKKLKKIINRCS